MSNGVVRKGTFKIVHQVNLDDDKLKRIAEVLGIPEAERDRIISGEIVIGPPPSPPSGGASSSPTSGGPPPSPPSGSTSSSPTSGRTRQRK